jgi:hypothetical protein
LFLLFFCSPLNTTLTFQLVATKLLVSTPSSITYFFEGIHLKDPSEQVRGNSR